MKTKTEINYKLALAPMAGVTDHAFRSVCKRFGAQFTYTEMISAKAVCFEDKKTASLAQIFDSEEPIAVQIFGSDPLSMAHCAEKIADCSYKYCKSSNRPAAIDINMGCPAPKVTGGGDGSALLKTPELAAKIVAMCADACDLPISVKMRIGWDDANVNGVDFAKRMEAAGASLVTVHGRTREGRFSAPINFDVIAEIKKSLTVPVVGNGEIFSGADALRMFERTGCDAVMIGRGALGNPWIFEEISAALDGREYVPPTASERVDAALYELSVNIFEKGERLGVVASRARLGYYLKGIRGASEARGAINMATCYSEVEDILKRLV